MAENLSVKERAIVLRGPSSMAILRRDRGDRRPTQLARKEGQNRNTDHFGWHGLMKMEDFGAKNRQNHIYDFTLPVGQILRPKRNYDFMMNPNAPVEESTRSKLDSNLVHSIWF